MIRVFLSVVYLAALSWFVQVNYSESTLAQPAPDRFLRNIRRNTLSGVTQQGVAYNLYFLAGGFVTYEDAKGTEDSGRWRVRRNGQVCIRWKKYRPNRQDCYLVVFFGRKVAWTGAHIGQGVLRGGIVESFLKPRK